jgi:dienelactone hydrolase
LPDKRLLSELIRSQYDLQSKNVIESLAEIKTHSSFEAPLSRKQLKYPLLILSPGLGEPRSNYTSFAEELASQGYVVVSVDHPYGGYTVLPNGRILTTNDDPRGGTPEGAEALMTEWSTDASFVLDVLLSRTRLPSELKPFVGHFDANDIGMFGHSLGGAAALETCRRDRRVKACADLDGAPFGKVKVVGVTKPTLIMRSGPVYSDADLAKRGRTREQWEEMGRQGRTMWASIEPKEPSVPYFNFSVLGAGHMSFSDSPFTMPDTITRFGGKITDFDRAYKIISSYIVDFFGVTLKHQKPKLIDVVVPPYQEVIKNQAS